MPTDKFTRFGCILRRFREEVGTADTLGYENRAGVGFVDCSSITWAVTGYWG